MVYMNSRKPTSHPNRGFTLVEILVALAIIAIALAALIKASGNHTASVAYLKQKSIAHWVAMNEITELQITKSWPGKGEKKGSAEMAGHEWFWLREIKEIEDENSHQVVFTIYLDEDRTQKVTKLIGYLTKPQATVTINQ
ncbi:MAG: type II secretion system minor pseudopilin GspI [Gammaproteobacteria bacterium]|nr:type II secretion system minor pseudopilin GspI [Gammaproteobacteria bacterium]